MNNTVPVSNENVISSFDINSNNIISKKNPKNPMRYLAFVSFVAFFIKDLVSAIPSYLYSLLIMFTSYYSSLTGNSFDLDAIEPLIEIFNSAFSSFTIIMFGILFVRHIINKTVFNGNIKKYKFIYYTWSFAVGGFLLDILGFISSLVLLKFEAIFDSDTGYIATLVLSSIVSVFSLGISIFAAYLCARLLNASALGDEKNQLKELRLLAIGTTVSALISLIVYIIRIVTLDEFSISTTITTFLSKIVTVVAIWIIVSVKPKNENDEKLIFTIIPIIVICDSIIYSLCNLFFS